MEGEVVFFTQEQVDEWKPQSSVPPLESDTTSALGQLYAEWTAANQRAREEYERRKYSIWHGDRIRKGFYGDETTWPAT